MRQGRGAPGAGLILRHGSVCTNNHKAVLGYTVADISWKGEGPAVFRPSGYVLGNLPVSSRCCKIRLVSRSVAGRHLSPFDVA